MKKTPLLAAFLLAACAMEPPFDHRPPGIDFQKQPPAKRSASYCHGANCTITISVDANCQVEATPYVFVMDRSFGALTAEWTLSAGPGVNAKFAAGGGIAFKGAAGQQVFTAQAGNDKKITFANSGTPGYYPYNVKVEVNGTACPTLDPTGVNDM